MKKLFSFEPTRSIDVVALGRVAIDLNPVPEDYYKPLSCVNTYRRYVGGSPANIAVGVARLGKKAGFIGKYAKDRFGDYVKTYLQEAGVDICCLTPCSGEEKTGLAFTEILSETQSSILMYRDSAADLQLYPDDICEEYIKSAKILVVSGTALSALPSRNAAYKAIQLAKRNGTIIVFDIDYRPQNWSEKEEVAICYYLAAMQSDIILGSREEFDYTELYAENCHGEDKQSADYWFSKGAKAVVIKHGKNGSNAFFADGKAINVKPYPVKLLKSFGGGDGYAAAFLCGLLEGWDLKTVLAKASACAAMLVSSQSCSEDMPTMAGIEAFEKSKNIPLDSIVSEII